MSSERCRANLDNLCAFWSALGAERLAIPGTAALSRSRSWPHRLWLPVAVRPSSAQAEALLAVERQQPCVVPVWRDDADPSAGDALAAVLQRGEVLARGSTLVMDCEVAALRWQAVASPALAFDDGKQDVVTWSRIAGRSFGYVVDPDAVARLVDRDDAVLVLARRDGEAVGTGLLFATGEVAGLHMLGVPPEARRGGIAGGVMLHLLREAQARGLRHAALQASAMGQGLYQKLGFARSGQVDWHSRSDG